MHTIKYLVDSIQPNIEAIRNDISNNTCDYLLPYLETSREYLLDPDLGRHTWGKLGEEGKEAFYLLVLMNEIYHYRPSAKNFLSNVAMYLPKDSSVYLRVKLFARLSNMNHIQNQYKALVISFLGDANAAYQAHDPYLDKDSVRQLMLGYFHTFVQKSRQCLSAMGQTAMVESILPEFVSLFAGNPFAMVSMGELLSIVPGNFDRSTMKIVFGAPAV